MGKYNVNKSVIRRYQNRNDLTCEIIYSRTIFAWKQNFTPGRRFSRIKNHLNRAHPFYAKPFLCKS